jgi:hypothetical protein
MFSFASNLYLQCFDTFVDFFMHSAQSESFPYLLESLIVFYVIESVCSLKMIFLYHRISVERIFSEGIFSGAVSSGGSA